MISRKIALIAAFCFTVLGCSEEQSAPAKTKTIESIAAASERLEGFFTILRKREDGGLHMLIKEDQLDKEFIHTVVAQDGVVQGGHFRGQYRENQVLLLRRHFDRIEFVENNTRFYFDPE